MIPHTYRLLFLTVLGATGCLASQTRVCADTPDRWLRISEEELTDRIRGGMLAQILGNLNGLPHEMKYIHEPGNVREYAPELPEGARTDDDTDLEWMYVHEMVRTQTLLIPYARVVELWRKHVNEGIWCANRFARELMDLGFVPPQTGSKLLNPWSEFNLSGQFVSETFGLIAPGMPQTASRVACHYTQVTVNGEPIQATQLFASMIATAFFEQDIESILDAGESALDPASTILTVVRKTREICRANPDDWRKARESIKRTWQVHNGGVRDWNGYELNTASTIAALIYGKGELVATLELAFNFGWDCDNNAATAGTIVGVLKGRDWINRQGWKIVDRYRNTTRAGLPTDETISSFEQKVIECAELVILQQGGESFVENGITYYRVLAEQPARVVGLGDKSQAMTQNEKIAARLTNPDSAVRLRAAYSELAMNREDALAAQESTEWSQAIAELRLNVSLRRCVAEAPAEEGELLKRSFVKWGLELPQRKVPNIDEQGWWQIASSPDLGALTSSKQELVDFAIWQASDGTWQLWSCIRNTKEPGVSRLFHGWEGQNLTDTDWHPRGILMRGDLKYGERRGGLQAPFVIREGGEYLMFYGDWDSICLATSGDGKQFRRATLKGKGPQLFTEGSSNNARDPMLLKINNFWHCYYSAMPGEQGAMFVRQSRQLRDWSKSQRQRIVYHGSPGKLWYHAECPHVIQHEGYFYLFRTSNYQGTPKTTVYRSLDPTNFGINDDSKIIAELPIAAPEIIRHDQRYWLAALNPQLDGIRVTTLQFVEANPE